MLFRSSRALDLGDVIEEDEGSDRVEALAESFAESVKDSDELSGDKRRSTREEYDEFIEQNPIRISESLARSRAEDREYLRKVLESLPEEKRLELLIRIKNALSGTPSEKVEIPLNENGDVDYERFLETKTAEIGKQEELLERERNKTAIIVD